MSNLCIIPAAAVADHDLSDTQVRVLCAIGTFTNRLGGNVWASVKTLAAGSNLSERTVQRCIPALIDKGYLRMETRTGRTNLYEIVLDRAPEGVTPVSGGVTLLTGEG
jgi:DNA-binding MarR family transcriptional regulator